MAFRRRAGKFLSMLRGASPEPCFYHPLPWQETGLPYFLESPAANPDGHGGYGRLYRFDAAGVPFTESKRGAVYDALVIARYALKMRSVARVLGDTEAGETARRMLPLLVESGATTGVWGRGPDPRAACSQIPHANVQGHVISAILRLVEGAPSPEIRDLLDRATARLLAPVEQGGTMRVLDGGPFLEEIPEQPLFFNIGGCIRGLFGLYDLADAIGHPEAERAAARIEQTLAANVGRFTTRLGWSLYGLSFYGHPYLCSGDYHDTTIEKVTLLAMRTGRPSFEDAARRWEVARGRAAVRCSTALAKSAQVLWIRDVRRRPLWGE